MQREKPVIFILWGRHAQAKKKLITNTNHYIIESVHPSPYASARRCFLEVSRTLKVNEILSNMDVNRIDRQFLEYINAKKGS